MPVTEKGAEILHAMEAEYGTDKGKQVFYASENAGTITGTDAALEPGQPTASHPVTGAIHPAAGILFRTAAGKALFLKRGPGGVAPGMWCFPGGGQEPGETIEECAKREATEELGEWPQGKLTLHTRSIAPVVTLTAATGPVSDMVDFTTFTIEVDHEFAPQLNGEHVGWAWAPMSEPPQPLHPGCQIALDRFQMDELGVARAMAAGSLTSPQRYLNMWLFDLRVSGTGVAYRNPKKDDAGKIIQAGEYVYRRPENYLTGDFLARCGGLPVVLLHPEEDMLTPKEFVRRIIGAFMFAYVKGDEVWGVARVYDDRAAEALTAAQLSTSPGVILGGGNFRMKTEDGKSVLIEGKASLLDHLAICERGVWDKDGEPSGVRNDSQTDNGDESMPFTDEDKKAIAEMFAVATKPLVDEIAAVRKDASTQGVLLDKLLSHQDSRKDGDEEKARKDSAHFTARGDSESDEDHKKRMDAAEEKCRADAMSEGEAEAVACDRAKRARKDAEDRDEKAKADRAKKDAAATATAAENEELRRRLAAVERQVVTQVSDEDHRALTGAQARADAAYSEFGDHAPRPLAGENLFDYRKRLAAKLAPHSPAWKGVDVLAMKDSATFEVAEAAIYADAAVAARNPKDLPVGQLRQIKKKDQAGRQIVEFVGPPDFTFIHGMKPRASHARINVPKNH